jgi:predicted transcriptional regulator
MAKKQRAENMVRVDDDTFKKIQQICEKEYYTAGIAVKVAINGYIIGKDNLKTK